MWRLLILLLLIGTQAQAGPWPRGKGKVFYSVHANVEYLDEFGMLNQYGTIYAEYGLTEKLTLGVDYSGSEIATDKAIAFLRYPIANGDRQMRYAIEMGIGLSDGQMAFRPGVSIGRGITWGQRHGWITLDTRALLTGASQSSRIESDFTFGLGMTERTKLILQLQGGIQPRGDNYLKFAPSVVVELRPRKPRKNQRRGKQRKPRKGKQFLEIGLTAGLVNYDNYAAKIGIWREF